MTDQTTITDQNPHPDYELQEVLQLTTPEQFKAIGDPTRTKILGLIAQRAATTKQIAEALRLPKGTVGHHLRVLEWTGLIRVGRPRPARAITEKYYGRVARLYRSSTDMCEPGTADVTPIPQDVMTTPLRQALSELAPSAGTDDPSTFLIT